MGEKATVTSAQPKAAGRSTRGRSAREAILDAAEKVFAEEGISASLRTIMAEAGVNVASINYHFGTRQDLLRAILDRRTSILTGERLERLSRARSRAGSGPIPIRDIVLALLEPTFQADRRSDEGWRRFLKVQSHLRSKPEQEDYAFSAQLYTNQHLEFIKAIAKSRPDLDRKEILWRYNAVLAVVIRFSAYPHRIKELSGGLCDPDDFLSLIEAIAPILVGILSAPKSVAAPAI